MTFIKNKYYQATLKFSKDIIFYIIKANSQHFDSINISFYVRLGEVF